jgi:hypothetical protein
LNNEVGVNRERIRRDFFAALVDNNNLGMQRFNAMFNDNAFDKTGNTVLFFVERDAFDNVFQFHRSFFFGNNRQRVRVPLNQERAFFDFGSLANKNTHAVTHQDTNTNSNLNPIANINHHTDANHVYRS